MFYVLFQFRVFWHQVFQNILIEFFFFFSFLILIAYFAIMVLKLRLPSKPKSTGWCVFSKESMLYSDMRKNWWYSFVFILSANKACIHHFCYFNIHFSCLSYPHTLISAVIAHKRDNLALFAYTCCV